MCCKLSKFKSFMSRVDGNGIFFSQNIWIWKFVNFLVIDNIFILITFFWKKFQKNKNYYTPNLGGKAYYVFAMMYIVPPIPKQLVKRLTHMKLCVTIVQEFYVCIQIDWLMQEFQFMLTWQNLIIKHILCNKKIKETK
jgi:hypothetical protein